MRADVKQNGNVSKVYFFSATKLGKEGETTTKIEESGGVDVREQRSFTEASTTEQSR